MSSTRKNDIGKIIRAYDDTVVKAYSWGRFKILRQRFLDEIGQYLPSSGFVLDVGCGFGLFSLYYALQYPDLRIFGIDMNAKRIEVARQAAGRLGLENVTYAVGDVTTYRFDEPFDSAYMLDIIHHIPREAARPVLAQLYERLRAGGRLVIKDVDTRPTYKRWFTHVLDKAMDPQADVNYWERAQLAELLQSLGFEVFSHSMVDVLPYPHCIYTCSKLGPAPVS